MQADPFALTGRFNREICGISDPDSPTRLQPARKEWTLAALKEEVNEFEDATELVDEVDALVDLIYFAAGRLQEMGVDGAKAFLEVHRCNMNKVRGELSKRPGSLGHDAVKPPGWTGPDYSWLSLPRFMFGTRVRRKSDKMPLGAIIDISNNGTQVTVELLGRYSTISIHDVELDQ